MSSTSQPSSPSPQISQRSFSPSASALYPTRTGEDEATAGRLRREARAKRRAEREKKSTLRGERYDSPLRRVVRWCAKNEWKGRSWVLGLVISLAIRLALNALSSTSNETSSFRELLAGMIARIPYLKSLEPPHHRYIRSLDNGLRHSGEVGMDTVVWYYAARNWTDTEAKATGRSWRTQTIAMTTLLFTPCFLLPLNSINSHPQWTLGATVLFLRYICGPTYRPDMTGLWLLALLDPRLALFIPAVLAHVMGRSLNGRTWLSWTWAVHSTYIHGSIQRISSRFFDYTPSFEALLPNLDLAQMDCTTSGPDIWCTSDVVIHWAQWIPPRAFYVLAAMSTTLAILPSLIILAYASWTAGPGDLKTSPASVKLLPTALFTSSLGLLLFLPSSNPSDYVTALVPLSLMTCMRGGKDDIGDDDDGWQWNALVHNVVVFISFPVWKRSDLAIPAVILTGLWNWLIGLRPLKLWDSTFRNNTLAVYAGLTLVCIGEHLYPYPDRFPSVWAVLRCLISFAVLFPAWIWGLSRLYLQTWALVGLRPSTGADQGVGAGSRAVLIRVEPKANAKDD